MLCQGRPALTWQGWSWNVKTINQSIIEGIEFMSENLPISFLLTSKNKTCLRMIWKYGSVKSSFLCSINNYIWIFLGVFLRTTLRQCCKSFVTSFFFETFLMSVRWCCWDGDLLATDIWWPGPVTPLRGVEGHEWSLASLHGSPHNRCPHMLRLLHNSKLNRFALPLGPCLSP